MNEHTGVDLRACIKQIKMKTEKTVNYNPQGNNESVQFSLSLGKRCKTETRKSVFVDLHCKMRKRPRISSTWHVSHTS